MRKANLAIGLVLGALTAVSAQSLTTWSKYKNIAINTKASGANVGTNVTNIPVLVRLDSTNSNDVFTGALANGADLRFAKADGTTLIPYQIESWNATAKKAAIWVLIDTVKANDSAASFRLYWGNASATSLSNGATVFDTANGYRAVYHMSGTGTEERDATVLANHMAASDSVVGSVPGDTVGIIGGARKFAGDSTTPAGRQYFIAPGTAGKAELNWGPNNPHTISAWVYAREFQNVYGQFGHGSSVFNKGDRQFAIQAYGDTGNRLWEGALYANANNGWRQVKSKVKAQAGAWVNVTTTWSGGANGTNGTGMLYLNGVLDSSIGLAIGTGTASPNLPHFTYNLYIGANPTGGSTGAPAPGTTRDLADGTTSQPRFWNGYIDNITLARGARSPEFVKLSYETQKANTNAVVLGSTVTQTVTPVAITNVRYNNVGTGNNPRDTLFFTINQPVNKPLMYDGGPADSAKLTGNNVTLPAGLSINLTTGLLSGTPTALFAAANRTLTVYSSLGNVTRGLIVAVLPGPLQIVKYTNDTVTYTVGVPVLNNPQINPLGRTPTKFSVTPALPAGLSIDTVNGAIFGTPSVAVAAANYTVKASNATDSSFRTLRITTTGTAENYSTWSRHRTLYLNTGLTSNGARIATDVRNFPLLVRLGNNDTVFTQALAAGADLRFTKADDVTPLPYQIESWDATAKTAAIWVLVDTVKGNSLTQTIRMHWGKAGVASLSAGATTFGTNNGFQGVWHMNAGGTGNEADATINGFTMTPVAAPADSAGVIGRGRYLDGATQYFQAANSAAGPLNHPMSGDLTLSAWVKLTSIATGTGQGNKIIDKGDNQYVLAIYGSDQAFDNGQHFWEMTIRGNNTWNQCTSNSQATGTNNCTGTATPRPAENDLGKWVHVLATYKGAPVNGAVAESLYVDGGLISSRQFTHTSSQGRNESYNVSLGVQAEGVAPVGDVFTRFLNGILDEVRISSAVRSADWVKLEYENQKANQNVVSTTVPTSIGAASAANVLAQGFAVKSVGQGLAFQMSKAHEGKAVLSLMDMKGRTVWTGSFAPGATQLLWNGTAKNGMSVNSGLYMARLSLLNNQGQAIQVQDRKVPYTR